MPFLPSNLDTNMISNGEIPSRNLLRERLHHTTEDLPTGIAYVVGVAIFKILKTSDGLPQWNVLVLKRAAHEDQFPKMWELPGGHVEQKETVRQAIDRETFEETGLAVDTVIGGISDFQWTSRPSGKQSLQLNYAATVKEPIIIKLRAEEHSDWQWISEAEISSLKCSEAMRKVIREALAFATEQLSSQL